MSTASLVFSGKGPVAEATGERVRAAAAELGFTGPNPLASSLRQGRSGAIGVLVEGRLRMAFRDPFAIAVLDGLAEVLEAVPTGMLLIGQPRGAGESVVPQLAPLALDAVVFSLCGPGENPAVEHLAARGIPMFSTGVPSDRRITQVRIDERAAGRRHRRARPLARAPPGGPRRHADAPDEHGGSRARRRGAARRGPRAERRSPARLPRRLRAGRPGRPDRRRVVVRGRDDRGARPARRAASRSEPTAVVAQSDVIAAGVILAAEELGLRVPEDLSVTGFDGVDLPWLPHRLTTMDQHGREKGRILGTLVRRRLDGTRPRSVTQPVELRVGTTTAPPR